MGELAKEDVPEGVRLSSAAEDARDAWVDCPTGERRERMRVAMVREKAHLRWRERHHLPLSAGTEPPDPPA